MTTPFFLLMSLGDSFSTAWCLLRQDYKCRGGKELSKVAVKSQHLRLYS